MNTFSKHIIDRLKSVRNAEKAAWLENYVKHDIKSLGVGIPEIREIVKNAEKDFLLTNKSISAQIQVLNELMKDEYTESKLASIIYLQLYWKEAESGLILELISEWFENWKNFSRSVKRGILEWILNAKRPETRQKRITQTVELAEKILKTTFENERKFTN